LAEAGDVEIRFDDAGVAVRHAEGQAERWLLRDVNGVVERGRIVALVGPSGSGKSTLLSLCNLLRTPSAGQVFIGDREVRAWRPHELRRRVALVFQQPTLLPGTVRDNVEAGPRLCGRRPPDAAALLEAVGLSPDLLDRPGDALSGGQRQRVALARALAMEPRVLLLDEVTSALDAAATAVVEAAVERWRSETGGTVLWVTHHLAQARRVSDCTWVLVEGRIVEQGPTERVFAAPRSEAAHRFLRGCSEAGQREGDQS
jgi:putative ABC transport system ATP-binding protein